MLFLGSQRKGVVGGVSKNTFLNIHLETTGVGNLEMQHAKSILFVF